VSAKAGHGSRMLASMVWASSAIRAKEPMSPVAMRQAQDRRMRPAKGSVFEVLDVGYDLQYFAAVEPQLCLALRVHVAICGTIARAELR
jgi:hypothetical protein